MSKPPVRQVSTRALTDPPTNPPTNPGRVRAQKWGRWAETLAALHLRLRGYRILARNYKTPVGELDMIAKRGSTVCFVEVKARDTQAQALEAVSTKQRSRIQRAAELFLIHHPPLQVFDIRFDVALVTGLLKFKHVSDAWRP